MITDTGPRLASARSYLRLRTDRQHEALHRHRLIVDSLRLTDDRSAYRALLTALFGIHDAFEIALAQAGRRGAIRRLGLPPLERATLLAADLHTLDARLDTRALGNLPRPPKLPRVDDVASYLGALYVLDGSTLGGRAIASTQIRSDPGRPVLFFRGRPAIDVPRWTACIAAIDRELERPSTRDRAAETAAATFDLLGSWFDRWLPPIAGQAS